jgi:DNA modification methylase
MSEILLYRHIGLATLYLGDCREILPTLKKADAVVTDPPYGIGADSHMAKLGGMKAGAALAPKRHYEATDWDSTPIDEELMDLVLASGKQAIVFGGNYYAMPPARCWLVWDKQVNGQFADAELAWTNLDKPVRLISHMWNGMLRKGQEERFSHPTQKPLGVMKWCLSHIPDANTIIDPFMGSGTTGCAAVQMGRSFIGIEREPSHFELACKRIEDAQRQGDMFTGAAA